MVFPTGPQPTTRFRQKATPEQVLSRAALPEVQPRDPPAPLTDDMQVDERAKRDRDEVMKEAMMDEEVEVITTVNLVSVVGPP
eukprot:10624492-Heterocapsa_arctica.AAC.1